MNILVSKYYFKLFAFDRKGQIEKIINRLWDSNRERQTRVTQTEKSLKVKNVSYQFLRTIVVIKAATIMMRDTVMVMIW